MTHETSVHTIMTIRTLQTAALVAIGLCAPALAQNTDPLAPVAWISGCWIAEGKEHGSGEMWLAPAGGTMLGVSRTVRDGKTIDFEFMQIRVNPEGKLVFVARPSNQRETPFVATTLAQGEVTFENASHDFPQRITYRRTGPETLEARIEGVRNGATRSIDFPMRRGSCERSG
jgi:hypothetical protein